jgi:predicted HicB family RNase H-like nuclease
VHPELIRNAGDMMPEIRASLSTELHRKLKAEAARKGVHLKDLIAKILEKHTNSQGGSKKK